MSDCKGQASLFHYFSDGCGGLYKNWYNFVNFCHHELDFDLLADCNIFATSHGKGACDGIGGTVKLGTLKASLQRPVNDQFLTSKDMFEFCSQMMHGIQFHFVSKESVLEVDRLLQTHFNNSHTIKGTPYYSVKFGLYIEVSCSYWFVRFVNFHIIRYGDTVEQTRARFPACFVPMILANHIPLSVWGCSDYNIGANQVGKRACSLRNCISVTDDTETNELNNQ